MRIKVNPLFTFLVLVFIKNIRAVDVQVPAGNRHLPGADSSIPENAYDIYITGGRQ